MATVNEQMICDCPVLSKLKDGMRVRYNKKNHDGDTIIAGTGTLEFVWLALDEWCADVRSDYHDTIIGIIPAFGDEIEVIEVAPAFGDEVEVTPTKKVNKISEIFNKLWNRSDIK